MERLYSMISIDELNLCELKTYHGLDSEVYGNELAEVVTEKLENNPDDGGLYHSDRDYCGLGLFFSNVLFQLTEVFDGIIQPKILVQTSHREEFTQCLAEQSDQSISRYGQHFNNPSLSRIRFIWHIDENYSPIWDSYCTFLYTSDHNL